VQKIHIAFVKQIFLSW